MKILLLALFFSAGAHAFDLDLNQEEMNIGVLQVRSDGLASQVLEVRRSVSTPENVYLNVTFKKEYKYCTKEANRRVWIATEYSPSCDDNRCTNGRVAGHWSTETYCLEYKMIGRDVSEAIKLDFDNAVTLVGNEEEIFAIAINQREKSSSDFNLSAKVIRANNPYEMTQKKGKNKLKFEFQK